METEIIKLIDTSVKIGLGAIIAAVSTYLITRYNHKADTKKEYFKRYISSIEEIAGTAEEYYIKLGRFVSAIDGVSRASTEINISPQQVSLDFIKKNDINLIDSREKQMLAVSRLRLLDIKDVSEILEEARKIENELREIVVFNRTIPSLDELDIFRDKINKNRIELSRI